MIITRAYKVSLKVANFKYKSVNGVYGYAVRVNRRKNIALIHGIKKVIVTGQFSSINSFLEVTSIISIPSFSSVLFSWVSSFSL